MKFNTAKRFCLTLAAALTLTALTACASSAAPQDTAPTDSPQSVPVSVGTILLSVNPEIEMSYDDRGNVVALTGLNDDGRAVLSAYTGYEGKACTDVVRELVEQIDAGGYFDATIGGHEKISS